MQTNKILNIRLRINFIFGACCFRLTISRSPRIQVPFSSASRDVLLRGTDLADYLVEIPGALRMQRKGRQRVWEYWGKLPGRGGPAAGKDGMGGGEEQAR